MQHSNYRFFLLALAGAFSFSATHATAAPFPLSQYDLVDLGNLTSSSDIEGAAWIGGDLSGSGGSIATMISTSASTVNLAVGGNISGGAFHVHEGSVTAGGTIAGGSIDLQQAGATMSPSTPINPTLASMTSALDGASSYFAGLSANSTTSVTGGNTFNFNITPSSGQAVFSITAASLFNGSIGQINLNNDNANITSIIINVTGTSVTDGSSDNMVGDFGNTSTQAKIVWNFVDATSIAINDAFDGALLAPGAALSNTSNINGAVGVASFTQNAEVHLPLSTVPTPEPVCGGVLILGAMTLLRRRSV